MNPITKMLSGLYISPYTLLVYCPSSCFTVKQLIDKKNQKNHHNGEVLWDIKLGLCGIFAFYVIYKQQANEDMWDLYHIPEGTESEGERKHKERLFHALPMVRSSAVLYQAINHYMNSLSLWVKKLCQKSQHALQ